MTVKLEIVPCYAKQLELIVRQHPDKAYLWDEVVQLAARRLREENGAGRTYPIRLPGFRPAFDSKVALRHIAQESYIDRWAFLSMAAREILKREGVRP